MSKAPYESIDFIPTENSVEVAHRMRDWIQANAGLLVIPRRVQDLTEYEGGYLYLELGGYVPNPELPGAEVSVEASFSIDSGIAGRLDPVIDPEGTYWYRHRFCGHANWPSHGSQGAKLARMRSDMISTVVSLAERFDAEFGTTVVWTKGMTRAERDEWELKRSKDATHAVARGHVHQAIHTTCRRMRVGDERFIPAPEGDLVPGTYEVKVENKTYEVEIHGEDHAAFNARFQFRRTK